MPRRINAAPIETEDEEYQQDGLHGDVGVALRGTTFDNRIRAAVAPERPVGVRLGERVHTHSTSDSFVVCCFEPGRLRVGASRRLVLGDKHKKRNNRSSREGAPYRKYKKKRHDKSFVRELEEQEDCDFLSPRTLFHVKPKRLLMASRKDGSRRKKHKKNITTVVLSLVQEHGLRVRIREPNPQQGFSSDWVTSVVGLL